jgi:formylglycine-generating enzyme required for sulfatase activity
MNPETPAPSAETGLIIRSGGALVMLPGSGTSAMAEMIGRSLVQIQASKALAAPQRRAGEECEFEIAPGVKLVMCWIPPGEFLMGSPEDEEDRDDDETQHRVRITRGYWLAKTQTTQAQWEAVMGSNPSCFKGGDLPVETVSWLDICGDESASGGFLAELNKRVPMVGRFHLPTEAQWEYACRAETTGAYAGDLDEMGWYCDNSEDQTRPVGQKKPNAWGIHDMHGNVWEWCVDWFGDYPEGAATDPKGPNTGSLRVYRGGSWLYDGTRCRSASRYWSTPVCRDFDLGFRVAAVPVGSQQAGASMQERG